MKWPTLHHVILAHYTCDTSEDTHMHNQSIVQIDPESKLLIGAQMDRVHLGELLNKCSVPQVSNKKTKQHLSDLIPDNHTNIHVKKE